MRHEDELHVLPVHTAVSEVFEAFSEGVRQHVLSPDNEYICSGSASDRVLRSEQISRHPDLIRGGGVVR
jgi:hypothetical protein